MCRRMPEDGLSISVVPPQEFQFAVTFQRPVQVPELIVHPCDDGCISQALAAMEDSHHEGRMWKSRVELEWLFPGILWKLDFGSAESFFNQLQKRDYAFNEYFWSYAVVWLYYYGFRVVKMLMIIYIWVIFTKIMITSQQAFLIYIIVII